MLKCETTASFISHYYEGKFLELRYGMYSKMSAPQGHKDLQKPTKTDTNRSTLLSPGDKRDCSFVTRLPSSCC